MNDRKIAVVALVIALLCGVVVLVRPAKTIIQQISRGEVPTVGAVTGPDLPYQYLAVNGIRTEYRSASMIQATSSVCSFQSPAATSTIAFAFADFSNIGTTSTSVFEWATSTNPTATTTRIGSLTTLAGGSQSKLVASTTDNNANRPSLPPNTYLVGKLGGSGGQDATHPQLYSPSGTCGVEFKVVAY